MGRSCPAVAAPVKSPEHAALGAAIRELREERGLTQEDFALDIGLHRNYYGACERGEVNVSWGNLLRIAAGLGVRMSDIVELYERRVD